MDKILIVEDDRAGISVFVAAGDKGRPIAIPMRSAQLLPREAWLSTVLRQRLLKPLWLLDVIGYIPEAVWNESGTRPSQSATSRYGK